MEPEMFKFPSIEQSRQVLPEIIKNAQFSPETDPPHYNQSAKLPVLEFRGTVKLHGTNAAIVQTISTEKTIHFQSRNRVLTIESDLMGFCAHMVGNMKSIISIFETISSNIHFPIKNCSEENKKIKAVAIFGEWCGMGIQKVVAISKLPRMFVIFAVKVVYHDKTSATWLDLSKLPEAKDEAARIFNILQFETYSLTIDFNQEESLAQGNQKMVELTMNVEAECPVGKHFGVDGIGEGIVWQAITSPNPSVFISSRYSDSKFWFKVKGKKHTENRKEKIVQKPSAEKISKMDAFLNLVLTPDRLQQGLQVLEREMLLPLEMKSIPEYIRWVRADVMKEEYDRIEEAGFKEREISAAVFIAAKKWYVEQLNS